MPFDLYQLDNCPEAEDAVQEYQAALLALFAQSPEGQARREVDSGMGFWAAQLIDYGYSYLEVTIPRMTVADLTELLEEIFPRKISLAAPEDAAGALPELMTFWQYLAREYHLTNAGAILRYLRAVDPEDFTQWMSDPGKFGMAKSFLMLGQAAGFDMTDAKESEAFVQWYNASRLLSGTSAVPAIVGEGSHRKKAGTKAKRVRKLASASRKKNRRHK